MITTKLYKGTVELCFDEAKHRFTINGRSIISVTKATSVIDKSGPLMGWAVKLMRNFLMVHLKELLKDTEGTKTIALIETASKQHYIKKKEAADVGEKIHDWIEQFIKAKTKKDQPPIPKDPQVYNGVSAFLKWVAEHNVKFISSEKFIYSKKYDYAGIMDAEAIINNKLSAIDFKSSNGIYPEMRFQVAGYQAASEEESEKKYPGDKWLIRFGKEDGEFEAHPYEEHDKDFRGFIGTLAARRRLMEITVPYKKGK